MREETKRGRSEVASSKDVAWSYVGTAFSLGSSFVLLPFLTGMLSAADLGLWYVFLAVASLGQLFEFGFNPAFARNFVYCLNGARELLREGGGRVSKDGSVDWHLYRTLLKAAKLLYAAISIIVLLLVSTVGTMYVMAISGGLEGALLVSWAVFVVAIFCNLYYLYALSNLSGLADVVGENKAKTFSSIVRLAVSIGLLFAGWGLLAAAIGYLMQGLMLRLLARYYAGLHADVVEGVFGDVEPVTRRQVVSALKAISPVACKNGADQLALYAATQGTSIVCSVYFTLAQTGVYSLGLQVASALATFCYAYPKAFYPSYQAAFARRDATRQRDIVQRCLPIFWAMALVGVAGVIFIAFPLLRLVKPESIPSAALFLLMAAYIVLLQHHTVFCNFILATNKIPFLRSFIVSSLAGVMLSVLLVGWAGMGIEGLILGQATAQAVYNNWKWPHVVARELSTSYPALFLGGVKYWLSKMKH